MSNAAALAKIEQAEKELAQLEGQYSDIVAEASLAGASMLPPPAGTAADIASLVVSLSKGNWGDALIDAVGFIPIGGDAVKAAIKGPKIVAKKKDIQAAIDAARVKLAQKKSALKTDPKDIQKKTAEACNKGRIEPCPNTGEVKNTKTKIGNQTYTVDDKGRTVKAEGVIDGSHKGRKKKYVPEPQGGRDKGDHRGHLIPEGGVDDVKTVNVKSNVVSESSQSNLGLKKKFDLKASKTKDLHPDSKVTTEHTPLYKGDETRPHAVSHILKKDGEVVESISILNPKNSSKK